MFTSNYHQNLVQNVLSNPTYSSAEGDPDHELQKYYTFDELGHVMVATTSKDSDQVSPELQTIFEKVVVFYGAWTAALSRKGKTLFDYDAVKAIIDKTGFFINTQMEARSFNSKSTSVSLDTTIIQSVLSGGVTGGGLAIAKRILAAIGNQITMSFSKQDTKKEICHFLFIVENLLNVPLVSVSIFHTSMDQMSWVQKTNCSQVSHTSIKFSYKADDYMFVNPELIHQFSPDFTTDSDFETLISQLEGYIPA
jgi:hypothetical protein